jgi:hypothetical protein
MGLFDKKAIPADEVDASSEWFQEERVVPELHMTLRNA